MKFIQKIVFHKIFEFWCTGSLKRRTIIRYSVFDNFFLFMLHFRHVAEMISHNFIKDVAGTKVICDKTINPFLAKVEKVYVFRLTIRLSCMVSNDRFWSITVFNT